MKTIKNRATALALEKKGTECPRDEYPPCLLSCRPDEEGYEEMKQWSGPDLMVL
ncbi:MAG: hypothetical protein IPN19_04625 [Elusimicrobia bacterium]|nr:hypothetical protein [Elusimicrobiota bacterium]